MTCKRTHPVFIFEGVKKLGLVFLLVLLRGFLTALDKGVSTWLEGAWTDVAVMLVIFTLATLRWWSVQYCFDGKSIAIKKGILFSVEKRIPIEKICSVTLEQPLLYRPFNATRICFYTLAGTNRRADISLLLPDKTAHKIADTLSTGKEEKITPNPSYVVLLSAFLSDSFAGAGIAAVFVTRVGTVIGEELQKRLVGAIDSLLHLIPSGLPPIAKTVAVIILLGWTVGFLSNLIRHYDLTLIRTETALTVKGGALTNRSTAVKLYSISFVNIKQGLFTKLLGIYTVFLNCTATGREKGDTAVLTDTGGLATIPKNLQELMLDYSLSKPALRPNKGSFLRFVADPLWALLPIALTAVLAIIFTDLSAKSVLSLATFTSIPAVWWLLVRLVDLFTSGIGETGDTLTLRYSSYLKLNTVLIKRDKIVAVKIRQSLFQRMGKRCDVFVYTKGKTAYRHRVKNLDVAQARKLLRI